MSEKNGDFELVFLCRLGGKRRVSGTADHQHCHQCCDGPFQPPFAFCMVTFSFYSLFTFSSYKVKVRAEPGLRKMSVKLSAVILSSYKTRTMPGPGPRRQRAGVAGAYPPLGLAIKRRSSVKALFAPGKPESDPVHKLSSITATRFPFPELPFFETLRYNRGKSFPPTGGVEELSVWKTK